MPRRRRNQPQALDGTRVARTPVPEMFPERPSGYPTTTELNDLVFDELDPGDLLDSIRMLGIIQPIAVHMNDEGFYTVVAGRRRATAARRLGMEEVPVIIMQDSLTEEQAAAMSLTENVVRRPNPLTDFQAIRTLMMGGANEQQISEQLHIPLNVLRSRMRLATLIPGLMRHVEAGRITPTLAATIAPLPAARQMELLDVLGARIDGAMEGERVRLTAADVRQVREAARTQARDLLPQSLFEEETPHQITEADATMEVSQGIRASVTGETVERVVRRTNDDEYTTVEEVSPTVVRYRDRHWVLAGGPILTVGTNSSDRLDGVLVPDDEPVEPTPGVIAWRGRMYLASDIADGTARDSASTAERVTTERLRAQFDGVIANERAQFDRRLEAMRQSVAAQAAVNVLGDIPATVTITDLEGMGSWPAIVRLLEAAERSFPAGPTNNSDTFYAYVTTLLNIARQEAAAPQSATT